MGEQGGGGRDGAWLQGFWLVAGLKRGPRGGAARGGRGATNGGHGYSMARRVREGIGRCKRGVRVKIAREKRGRFAEIDEPRSAVR